MDWSSTTGQGAFRLALKRLLLTVVFASGFPLNAFAGSFTGTIQAVHVNYTLGDILFVWVTGGAGAVSGAPSCSAGTNYQFAVDLTTSMGQQTMALLLSARATGTAVTILGTGTCSVYNAVETLNYLVY